MEGLIHGLVPIRIPTTGGRAIAARGAAFGLTLEMQTCMMFES
jgi:hypothetical protein